MIIASSLAAGVRKLRRAWRQAVRMTAAALLAHACTTLFQLHQGQWAVITCLVVVQGTIANTLDASLSRIYGTLAGAAVGGLGVFVALRTGLPSFAVLGLAVAPLAVVAAADARFRLGPVTAALVVLAVSSGEAGYAVAIDRVSEILFGAIIGVACTLLIFPERARDALTRHSADALALLGEIARAHIRGGDVEPLQARMDIAFSKAQVATAEVIREQGIHLGGGPSPRPFMTALRRLRTDVALIERAALSQEIDDAEPAATAIGGWFAAAAEALRAGQAIPTPPAVDETVEEGSGFGAFAFALAALRRDQLALQARVEERRATGDAAVRPSRPRGS